MEGRTREETLAVAIAEGIKWHKGKPEEIGEAYRQWLDDEAAVMVFSQSGAVGRSQQAGLSQANAKAKQSLERFVKLNQKHRKKASVRRE